jgi:WD40 repeat protein
VLGGRSYGIGAVVFSPDGQLVASASWDNTVRVWKTATGMRRSVLEGQSPPIDHLGFLSGGRVLHTNKGDIILPPFLNLTSPIKQEEPPFHLSVEDQWVLRNTQRLL